MLALHLRANRKETVVGWYASAALGDVEGEEAPDLIANTSSLIHEFYAEESDEGDPISQIQELDAERTAALNTLKELLG